MAANGVLNSIHLMNVTSAELEADFDSYLRKLNKVVNSSLATMAGRLRGSFRLLMISLGRSSERQNRHKNLSRRRHLTGGRGLDPHLQNRHQPSMPWTAERF
jgi:hypothetical protein